MRWHLDHAASGNRLRLFAPWRNGYGHIYLGKSFRWYAENNMGNYTRRHASRAAQRHGMATSLWKATAHILLFLLAP